MTRRARRGPSWALAAGAAVVLALVPFWTSDPYWMNLLASGLAFGILAMSLDVVWGYAGILNLAPAVSFGIGAYGFALVTQDVEGVLGTYLGIGAAMAGAAALTAVVALVSLRAGARGIYFALITLALGLALERGAQAWYDVTGGSNGLIGIAMPELGGGLQIATPLDFYWLILVATALAFVVSAVLVKRRTGTVLEAIRESEQRAETLGYSTIAYRVFASAFSGALGGLAGALYAPLTGIVEPSVFGVALSVQVFVWVAVGGQATLIFPLLAALAITIGQSELSGSAGSWYLLIMGVIFILVVLVLPGGVASLAGRLTGPRRPRLGRPSPPPEVADA